MNLRTVHLWMFIFVFTSSNVFALSGQSSTDEAPKQNGGVIFQRPVDKVQQYKDESARKAAAARKKTEELNKQWRKQQRKAEKAKAKAKAQAEKRKKKAQAKK